jgi:hypothetical protein
VALLAVGLDPQLLDAPVRGHDREHRDGLPPGYLDAATQGVRASLVIASGVAIAAGVVADPYLGRTGALGTT